MSVEDGTPSRPDFRRIVWPLAIAETIIWAGVYYAFPALLPAWESDLGWSKTALSGAFTLSLLAGAVVTPIAGRLIDHGHGRLVLTGGAILGAIFLLLLSQVTLLWQFYALWIGLGIVMACSLYQACFAFLTHALGERSRRAITVVSLVAGFAGTVSFPTAHSLVALADWRLAVVVFAIAILVVSVPLFWIGARPHPSGDLALERDTSKRAIEVMRVARTAVFWLMALSFAAVAINHGIITTHILPILADRGVHEDAAVLAAAMIGPMQVAGRLAMMAAERHVSTRSIVVACNLSLAVAAALLLAAGFASQPGLVAGFVILMGAGVGVTSIIRPVVVAELLGRRNFGLVSGLLAMPTTAGYAAAPTLAALLWAKGQNWDRGYDFVLVVAILLALLGLATVLAAWRSAKPAASV
ncbi:MAG: MFS transporter [Rhodospirillaceae bacterium]|nr:MFS transporter [Rhodospirillaceae bacterium]